MTTQTPDAVQDPTIEIAMKIVLAALIAVLLWWAMKNFTAATDLGIFAGVSVLILTSIIVIVLQRRGLLILSS